MKNKLLILCISIGMFSKAQSLQEYLNIAKNNNPELKAMQYQYESALEKVNEVGSLPNTTIGAGYFVQEAETRVGAQKAKLSVSQMLPWFGTLEAKKESASLKAETKLNNIDLAKRKLFLEVKTRYFQLFELKATAEIVNENIKILETFENLALTALENNKATMVDILKIRMKKNELSNNLNSIHENFKATQIGFNLLLNTDEKTVLNVFDNSDMQFNNQQYQKELISNNPKLLELDNLKSSLEKYELATKKEGLPLIGLGIDYVFVDERPGTDLLDNGKDIVMPMLSISIPLFSKKYSSKQKQLQLDQKAIESTKVNTLNQLYALYESAKSKMKSAKVDIQTQNENINQAMQAEKVLLTAYETSTVDFEQLLEIQQLKLTFQLKKVLSEKEYAIQNATLAYLTSNN